MVLIRPFKERDNSAMLDIEKLCPQGNERYAIGVDKSPNAIARYELYDNWNILVAEEEGVVAGWIGWTIKHNPIQRESYVYLVEVMIHPEFRRKGIATKLVMEAEKNAQGSGSGYIYCFIFGPNYASKTLFKELGYSNIGNFKSYALPVYKRANIAQKFKIERINRTDVPDAVSLINAYYAKRTHFVPYTPESFESYVNRIPAYGLENFWVVKDDGKIVACAGLWDCSVLQRMYFAKVPFAWKVMKKVFGFLNLFSRMPKIPAEEEFFKVYYVTDHAFEPNSSDAMLNLIGCFNNILFDARWDFLLSC